MTIRSRSLRHAAVAILAVLIAACNDSFPIGPPNGTAATTTFGGQATVVIATVPGLAADATLGDMGPLPIAGGSMQTSMLQAQIPGVISVNSLHASMVGQGDVVISEASVSDLHILIGGNTIDAGFVLGRATARCLSRQSILSGDAQIDALVINGTPVSVTGAPGQMIELPGGGQVILGEETVSANGAAVIALHVVIPGEGDVSVGNVHAEITCGTQCPRAQGDFVTGGGWMMVNGSKASFGVSGGSTPIGDLTYIDPGAGVTVEGTGAAVYTLVDQASRKLEGSADIDGVAGSYTLIVSDLGEPGSGDTFELTLSTGYHASGTLGGGNIQVHAKPAGCN
jgi:hypothetical protein